MGTKEGAGACGPSEKTISNFGRVWPGLAFVNEILSLLEPQEGDELRVLAHRRLFSAKLRLPTDLDGMLENSVLKPTPAFQGPSVT